jgi:hypothetical protein
MSSDKLNKIAGMYNSARAISDNAKIKGSAEEMEEAVEKGTEDTLQKKRRSKKLSFSEEEGAKTEE